MTKGCFFRIREDWTRCRMECRIVSFLNCMMTLWSLELNGAATVAKYPTKIAWSRKKSGRISEILQVCALKVSTLTTTKNSSAWKRLSGKLRICETWESAVTERLQLVGSPNIFQVFARAGRRYFLNLFSFVSDLWILTTGHESLTCWPCCGTLG